MGPVVDKLLVKFLCKVIILLVSAKGHIYEVSNGKCIERALRKSYFTVSWELGLICLCILIAGGHFMRKLLLDGRRFPKMHLDLQRLLQVFAEFSQIYARNMPGT